MHPTTTLLLAGPWRAAHELRRSARVVILAFVTATTLLMGCTAVVSLQPLYTAQDTVTDARLAGSWVSDGKTIQITAAGSSYDISIDDGKGEQDRLMAHPVELSGKLFVDLSQVAAGDSKCFACVPMHLIGELTVEDDTLRVRFLDASWVEEMAKVADLPAARSEDALILFAETAKFREFLENYGQEPAAFTREEFVWTRSER